MNCCKQLVFITIAIRKGDNSLYSKRFKVESNITKLLLFKLPEYNKLSTVEETDFPQ